MTTVTLSLFYFITEVSTYKMHLQGIMLWEFHTSLIFSGFMSLLLFFLLSQ